MIRAQLPVDERRVATYERVMEAQERIALARTRAGATDLEIDAALEACEPSDVESLSDEELYSGTVARFVSALGGRVEGSAAVFGDQTVPLPAPEG
ncbi:MAG: hypothetical protein ACJ780_07610 [Solirubrobacteraceae bacterium]